MTTMTLVNPERITFIWDSPFCTKNAFVGLVTFCLGLVTFCLGLLKIVSYKDLLTDNISIRPK
jgi:hypothetical protein